MDRRGDSAGSHVSPAQAERLARLRALLTPEQLRALREVMGITHARVVSLAELYASDPQPLSEVA